MLSKQFMRYSTRKISNSANFKTLPYFYHNLDSSSTLPRGEVSLTRQDALKFYTQMKRSRLMENECAPLSQQGYINQLCHIYSGQEACAVGIFAEMHEKDLAITSYRNHVWAHLLGAEVSEVLTECTGRSTGIVNGKSGSMHMFTDRFFGGNAMLCGQVPNGAGMALAMKLRKEPQICVTCYGDGTANQGQLYETYNMAKLWNLPILFVCENNRFGRVVESETLTSNTKYYTRCDYIPGIRCDGIDIISIREAARFARNFIISGNGPLILELQTEYHGHSAGPNPKTPPRDPIFEFRAKILTQNLAEEKELDEIDKDLKKLVEKAVFSAKNDDFLPMDGLFYGYLS
ncbi:unnamed protein product [Caenorhabditis angaria]|uniref:Dehydrogenase E1 component domain-containing protein n=1 Tax=Caenorhabditis angaria TaxID=860376 RepID=A0A9P1I635_9PELO|nr:unnamed protein product [Caenorhabditis angaria]